MKQLALNGDSSRHLSLAELERAFLLLAPPKDVGPLALIVSRSESGERQTLDRAVITPTSGIPGDAWGRRSAHKLDMQITAMRVDVARLIANGQPLSLFGDNLLVDLDLSVANLPPGSRVRLGSAILAITPYPHTGCVKFRTRFGNDALQLTNGNRFRDLRLRGIYFKVEQEGEIAVGDLLEVLSRG